MFIAAVVLASKFIEDTNAMAQSIYRLVVPLYHAKEINEMERSFLGKERQNVLALHNNLNSFLSLFELYYT